ncbi:hypothetical protein SELMODRAFT_417057 [Selaginella moellendorffii]|uniref:Uncharacterized protein n=1 Tax=Selaginella moellendorffii TaxID=88036 RepID=D8S182_SELML|nr:hypothetical protein SELMODRAFT_417057 [Selaginella moellendorffii]
MIAAPAAKTRDQASSASTPTRTCSHQHKIPQTLVVPRLVPELVLGAVPKLVPVVPELDETLEVLLDEALEVLLELMPELLDLGPKMMLSKVETLVLEIVLNTVLKVVLEMVVAVRFLWVTPTMALHYPNPMSPKLEGEVVEAKPPTITGITGGGFDSNGAGPIEGVEEEAVDGTLEDGGDEAEKLGDGAAAGEEEKGTLTAGGEETLTAGGEEDLGAVKFVGVLTGAGLGDGAKKGDDTLIGDEAAAGEEEKGTLTAGGEETLTAGGEEDLGAVKFVGVLTGAGLGDGAKEGDDTLIGDEDGAAAAAAALIGPDDDPGDGALSGAGAHVVDSRAENAASSSGSDSLHAGVERFATTSSCAHGTAIEP